MVGAAIGCCHGLPSPFLLGVHAACLPATAAAGGAASVGCLPAPRARAAAAVVLLCLACCRRHPLPPAPGPHHLAATTPLTAARKRTAPAHCTAVWVYCGDKALCGAHHKECWLKHLAHPYGTAPAKEGPDVGWTTGILAAKDEAAADVGVRRRAARAGIQGTGWEALSGPGGCLAAVARLRAPGWPGEAACRCTLAALLPAVWPTISAPLPPTHTSYSLAAPLWLACRPPVRPACTAQHVPPCPVRTTSVPQGGGGAERAFHVVITAAGSAVHWQSRVGYYWFKKIKKQVRGSCRAATAGRAARARATAAAPGGAHRARSARPRSWALPMRQTLRHHPLSPCRLGRPAPAPASHLPPPTSPRFRVKQSLTHGPSSRRPPLPACVQCEAAGGCQMGGFTRLLHTGQPDNLMNEIPTWVAQPLPAEHPDHG